MWDSYIYTPCVASLAHTWWSTHVCLMDCKLLLLALPPFYVLGDSLLLYSHCRRCLQQLYRHWPPTSSVTCRQCCFVPLLKYIITASDTITPQPTLYSQHVVAVNGILSPASTKDISRQLWPRNLRRAMSNVFRLSDYLPCPYLMIHSCSSSWLLIITPCTNSLVRTQWCQSQLTRDYFLILHQREIVTFYCQ